MKHSLFSPKGLSKSKYEVFANKRVNPISYVQLDNHDLPGGIAKSNPHDIQEGIITQKEDFLIAQNGDFLVTQIMHV